MRSTVGCRQISSAAVDLPAVADAGEQCEQRARAASLPRDLVGHLQRPLVLVGSHEGQQDLCRGPRPAAALAQQAPAGQGPIDEAQDLRGALAPNCRRRGQQRRERVPRPAVLGGQPRQARAVALELVHQPRVVGHRHRPEGLELGHQLRIALPQLPFGPGHHRKAGFPLPCMGEDLGEGERDTPAQLGLLRQLERFLQVADRGGVAHGHLGLGQLEQQDRPGRRARSLVQRAAQPDDRRVGSGS